MIRFTDSVRVGDVKETKEGFLVATARVARTGVQLYLAEELGDVAYSAGFGPGDVVRVHRDADQVFSDSVMRSITRVPVTLNHPAENVIADNWSRYAVGEVGDAVTKQGDWIVVNPMVKDASAITAAKTTHKEISLGYEAKIVKARDGVNADFEMTDLHINHLALVPAGRAGHQARIGDSWGAEPVQDYQPGVKPKPVEGGHMSDQLKTVVLGDKAVQVAVSDVAAIEQFKKDSAKALADAQTKHEAAITAKDEEIGKLRVELQQAKDAANIDVDSLVAARTELVNQVKAIDAKIETAGKSDADLRKAAVAAKLGDEIVADASDAEISGMFKALSKVKPSNPVADAIKYGSDESNVNDAQSAYVARLTRQSKKEG